MRITSSAMFMLLLAPLFVVHGQPGNVDVVPLIAKNGGVEIQSIEIERRKVSYAVKSADIVNMTVALLLTVDGKHQPEDRYMMRLRALDVVEDDTGKLLTTKQRLAEIPELKGEVSNSSYSSHTTGSHGPVMYLRLDAPARAASTIKVLKGTVEVRTVRMKRLTIADMEKSHGKQLEHHELKDMPIVPSITVKDGYTTVTLRVPRKYKRIIDWDVSNGGKGMRMSSETGAETKDTIDVIREYEGEYPKNCTLHLSFPVPGELKTLSFEFKNLELP